MRAIAFVLALLFLSACAEMAVGTDQKYDITYTDHGAQAEVRGDSGKVNQTAAEVFSRMGFVQSGNQWSAGLASLQLKVDGDSSSSHVEVISKTGTLSWNQDFAAQVIQEIARATGS